MCAGVPGGFGVRGIGSALGNAMRQSCQHDHSSRKGEGPSFLFQKDREGSPMVTLTGDHFDRGISACCIRIQEKYSPFRTLKLAPRASEVGEIARASISVSLRGNFLLPLTISIV